VSTGEDDGADVIMVPTGILRCDVGPMAWLGLDCEGATSDSRERAGVGVVPSSTVEETCAPLLTESQVRLRRGASADADVGICVSVPLILV